MYKILTFNLPTWNTVITDVSIPSTIPVYGNGKTIGLTDGSNNYGFSPSQNNSGNVLYNGGYGSNAGTNTSGNLPRKSMGITTATDGNSGIVAKSDSIIKTSQTYNFCIKY